MDSTSHTTGSFQQALLALMPALSSLSYLSRDKEFGWKQAILYLLPVVIPVFLTMSSPLVFLRRICGRIGLGASINRPLQYTARIRLRNWNEEPDAIVRLFSTVLWDWNRKNELVNCRTIDEEAIGNMYWNEMEHDGFQPLFVNDAINSFSHKDRPHIQYKMWVERYADREGVHHPEIFLQIQIQEQGYTPKDLMNHIEDIRRWSKYIQKERSQKQRVLVTTDRGLSGGGGGGRREDDNSHSGPPFMVYEFATTSTFNNFFCEEAALVKQDLQHFLHNKNAYERTGKPWTYTVLNSGPPGVGKTKLVKAIAALTGRTLIVINLNHIKDMSMLYEAFHSSVLAGQHVNHDNRLYYIPEVDTQTLEVLKKRETVEAAPVSVSQPADLTLRGRREFENVPHTSRKPTLGEILNVLDGVPERHGHILVLDTNHLDRLDPALIRPGRVDRILMWNKLSSTSMHAYLENYYETIIPKTVNFPDRSYTAAELQTAVNQVSSWKEFVRQPLLPRVRPRRHVGKN